MARSHRRESWRKMYSVDAGHYRVLWYDSNMTRAAHGCRPIGRFKGGVDTHTLSAYDMLNDQEVMDAEFTNKNSTPAVRNEVATIFAYYGYHGPVSGGEARVLKSLFTELGMPELVRHGWVNRDIEVLRQPTARQIRRHGWYGTGPAPTATKVTTARLQGCFVFKSPMPDVPFNKFIKLARMYKDDKGKLREAVTALMANPDAHKEIETLDTLDILAGLTGLDG